MNSPKNLVMNKETVVDLVKQTRGSIEILLNALGWPKDEEAFHRCIDRLLQLEEGHR